MKQKSLTLSRRDVLLAAPFGAALSIPAFAAAGAPAPYGVLPTERQIRRQNMDLTAFLHFTVNTFTDREWGYGDEPESVFNPTEFDADQMISALKAAGVEGAILTCKHHDGFCLWPTRTTEHNITKSPWRGGKGDVVKEVAEAAKRHGMKFGVYLSPWDRNSKLYGSPEYVDLYRAQLRELLTQYGPIYEIWHDGANGGDGYYGGAREKRTIDKYTYYGWPKTWDLIRQLQPEAVIFSDIGPDLRWVGNENGFAAETCWATIDPLSKDGGPGAVGDVKGSVNETGTRNGKQWMAAECDVSIRPGWFWHEKDNAKVRTPDNLIDLYYKSVGRGATLLLNSPPDRRGILHETDVAALKAFGDRLHKTFEKNLAAYAKVKASSERGKAWAGANLTDGDRRTYWSTPDAVHTPEAVIELAGDVTFNVARVREEIRLGQRVDSIAVEVWKNGAFEPWQQATSVGACRLLRSDQPVTTNRVRLRVTAAPVAPALSEFALFAEAR